MGFVSAAMGVMSLIGANKEAKAAKAAAKSEAALNTRVTQEKVFNLGQEERTLAGQTRATAAGSGVKSDVGSPLDILAEQARTFAREKQFTQEVGSEKSGLAIQRGKNAASSARWSGAGSALQAFGQSGTATAANGFFGF